MLRFHIQFGRTHLLVVVGLNPVFLLAVSRSFSHFLRPLSGLSRMAHSMGSSQNGYLLSTRPKGECLLLFLVSFQGSAD